MRKKTKSVSVDKLRKIFGGINFPEYQREPNIWSLSAKQRLIDSMMRRFDIASLYFYEDEDGSLDCIDGRQRLNAIMAFLGENEKDDHNGFEFRVLNEIYEDEEYVFGAIDGFSYKEISESARRDEEVARQARNGFLEYEVTFVLLADVARPEEFNLQFARLNLGTIINAGEKLHAMVGEMRDVCFDDDKIGRHEFLDIVSIPTRRYAKEQVAAQVLAQVFSRNGAAGRFTRARHFDLQKFFKSHDVLNAEERSWIEAISKTFDALAGALVDHGKLLRNRAIAVTTVLVAWSRSLHENPGELTAYVEFLKAFLCRLHWQIGKGLEADLEYRYLIDFQRHVTQASVEEAAVKARFGVMVDEFDRWLTDNSIKGDTEYRSKTGGDPNEDCRGGGGS